jgi:hypothetical protein
MEEKKHILLKAKKFSNFEEIENIKVSLSGFTSINMEFKIIFRIDKQN